MYNALIDAPFIINVAGVPESNHPGFECNPVLLQELKPVSEMHLRPLQRFEIGGHNIMANNRSRLDRELHC